MNKKDREKGTTTINMKNYAKTSLNSNVIWLVKLPFFACKKSESIKIFPASVLNSCNPLKSVFGVAVDLSDYLCRFHEFIREVCGSSFISTMCSDHVGVSKPFRLSELRLTPITASVQSHNHLRSESIVTMLRELTYLNII